MKKSVIKALSVLFVGLFMVAACNKKEATGTGTATETATEK
ncbi:MAG: hypothetical protein RL012_399 [Bacteroidota bacterium]|jgi:uncharacterized lipoprotein YajG